MQIEQIRTQLDRLILGPAPDPFQVENLSAELASLLKAVAQECVKQQGRAAATYGSVAPHSPLPPPPAHEMVAAAAASATAASATASATALAVKLYSPSFPQLPGRANFLVAWLRRLWCFEGFILSCSPSLGR